MNIHKLLYQNIIWRGLYYLLTFILNILIARHFKAELTGVIYYLVNIYAFITLIASVSLESGLIYFASSKKISQSKLFSFSIIWVACIALLMAVLFFGIVLFSEIKITSIEFLYALLFVCGNLLFTFLNSLFYADNKFKVPNVTGIVFNSVLIALIFFFNKFSWLTNEKYILIYFAAFLLQGITLIIIFITEHPGNKFQLPAFSQIKMLFQYCLLAFASNLVTFLYYRVDYWFVHQYRSPVELGNYVQVSKLAQMFFVLPGILAGAVFPITAGGRRQEINDILMILSRSILFLYGIACLIFAIAGKWLFPFVFGDSFDNMYVPFLFLIPGILALSTLYTLTAYYAGKNRIMVNLQGALLTLFIILLGDILFIPSYGINAAAAVSSVGYIAYHIYVLSVFTKEYKTSALGFFIFRFSDIPKMKRSILKNFIS